MSKNKTGRERETSIQSQHAERILPYKSFLFFSLVGCSILFLSLIFLYILWLTKNPNGASFNLPKPFVISTIVLLLSNFTVTKAQNAFNNDDSSKLLFSIVQTLTLTLVFASLQMIGWVSLYNHDLALHYTAKILFVFVITGLHFLHVCAGVLWQFYLSLRAFDVWNDPVKSLLYFSNKFEGTRIDLFSTYWHYLNILWLCLFFIFLFTL